MVVSQNHLCAGLIPTYALRVHLVVFYRKTIGGLIEVDGKSTVVSGIGSHRWRTDAVAADYGTRLIGERVDAAGIIELTGIVADNIVLDAVVAHTAFEGSPSPAHTDS